MIRTALTTLLLVGLFGAGQARAQTELYWDSNGNLAGSSSAAQRAQFSRDLAAYNEARRAGKPTSYVPDVDGVRAERNATLRGAGGWSAAVKDIVKHPFPAIAVGAKNLLRTTPAALVGSIAVGILADAAIDYVNGQFSKQPEILGSTTQSWQPTCTGSIRNKEFYAYLNGRPYKYIYKAAEGVPAPPAPTAPVDTAEFTYQLVAQCNFGSTANPPYIVIRGWRETPRVGFPAPPVGEPATDSQIQSAFEVLSPAEQAEVTKWIFDNGGYVPLDAVDPAWFNVPEAPLPISSGATTSRTVSEGPSGQTITEKTTTPHATVTSAGSNVTNNTITTTITNVTTTTVNGVTTETTTETPAEKPVGEEQDLSFSDAPFPEIPELYEQKYPDGLAGVWQANKPDVKSTAFYQGVASMFPNFGGGQCPVWTMSFNLGAAGNFGMGDLTVPCWIFQALGLVILATAAFTARKILF